MYILSLTVIGIAFERTPYTFLEPGSASSEEDVCVIIVSGEVSADSVLTVTTDFIPGTATRKLVIKWLLTQVCRPYVHIHNIHRVSVKTYVA